MLSSLFSSFRSTQPTMKTTCDTRQWYTGQRCNDWGEFQFDFSGESFGHCGNGSWTKDQCPSNGYVDRDEEYTGTWNVACRLGDTYTRLLDSDCTHLGTKPTGGSCTCSRYCGCRESRTCTDGTVRETKRWLYNFQGSQLYACTTISGSCYSGRCSGNSCDYSSSAGGSGNNCPNNQAGGTCVNGVVCETDYLRHRKGSHDSVGPSLGYGSRTCYYGCAGDDCAECRTNADCSNRGAGSRCESGQCEGADVKKEPHLCAVLCV